MTTTAVAAWWRALPNGQAACDLCPVGCRLRPGQTGPCGTRANRAGAMVPLHYGRVVSAALDPVEKKPLYHFHPGRTILSVAAPGCNLHCAFCQNWSISQRHDAPTRAVTPAELAALARRQDAVGVAYTYSEPLVWYEFVRDAAAAVRAAGLANVVVTNGYLNREPLAALLPHLDAANIDLKSMDDRFYRKVCRAQLGPVLAAIRQVREAGVHLELTNLVIPGHNDAPEQIDRLVDWIADLDPDIPLHLSAYHPAWRMDAPATPRATLERAFAQASRRLRYVYLGNVAGELGRDTRCAGCGAVAVVRQGYATEVRMNGAACPGCGARLPVVTA
ncbi:MAG TPA: AmmeMemoRadiSam system radical SAM enzyme [Candidatus Krumholzibacteria bacterium]|nr:AmmeMemoRadiSam system radical SAM enzyme [Candidatus Krumholzibacteria bacterium]